VVIAGKSCHNTAAAQGLLSTFNYSKDMIHPRFRTLLPALALLIPASLLMSSCTGPTDDPVIDSVDDVSQVALEEPDNGDVAEEATAEVEQDVWPKLIVFQLDPYQGQDNCEPGPDSNCELTEEQYVSYLMSIGEMLSERFANVPFELSQDDWTLTLIAQPEHQEAAFGYLDAQIDQLSDLFYNPDASFATIAGLVDSFDISADRTEVTVTLVNEEAYSPNLLGFNLEAAGTFGWTLEDWLYQHQRWQGKAPGNETLTITYLDGQTGSVIAVENY